MAILLCKICGKNLDELDGGWYCVEHGKQVFEKE